MLPDAATYVVYMAAVLFAPVFARTIPFVPNVESRTPALVTLARNAPPVLAVLLYQWPTTRIEPSERMVIFPGSIPVLPTGMSTFRYPSPENDVSAMPVLVV